MANRKFLYGDTVVATDKDTIHGGHTGKIGGTLIVHRDVDDLKSRIYYRVACECGLELTREAWSIVLVGTPTEMPDVPITEMRIQYFLSSIGFPGGTVDSALSQLSQREKNILERRNGLTGENRQTLRDIARVVGVSAQRILAIEAAAMKKLRALGSR